MPDEKDKRIEELTKKLDTLQRGFDKLADEYTRHSHTGKDGTQISKDSIELLPGQAFKAGSIALVDAPQAANLQAGRFFGSVMVGNDSSMINGSENLQLNIDHQSETTTMQSFIYAFRKPIAFGTTGSITSGGTTLNQGEFTFDINVLDGAYIDVYDSTNTFKETFEIASNTAQVITITGGTWSYTASSITFQVFMPVYLGAADFPFRRIYTDSGINGGIRFGVGPTNAGQKQNGLFYLDMADGNLYFRKPDGTTQVISPRVDLSYGIGAPSGSAAKGSLYVNTSGNAANNRIYINTDGSTGWTYLTAGA